MSASVSEVTNMKDACDCHLHFYGCRDEYPQRLDAAYQPPPATPGEYKGVMSRLGLRRMVAVQSVIYGTDNSCMLDAMRRMNCQTRGVAVVPANVNIRQLKVLHDQGIRGVRAFMLEGGIYQWSDLPRLAEKINSVGWHLQVQLNGRELERRGPWLAALGCPLVIDHIGKFIPPVDIEHPAFVALRRLIDGKNCWVKLSAPYESSRIGPPHYDDIKPLAVALVRQAPERMLWGTNWPHTAQNNPPSEASLMKLLFAWAPSPGARRAILCTNPGELYGFEVA
ncbi:MAG: amidohydrolase [Halocynthiibacter sp.]